MRNLTTSIEGPGKILRASATSQWSEPAWAVKRAFLACLPGRRDLCWPAMPPSLLLRYFPAKLALKGTDAQCQSFEATSFWAINRCAKSVDGANQDIAYHPKSYIPFLFTVPNLFFVAWGSDMQHVLLLPPYLCWLFARGWRDGSGGGAGRSNAFPMSRTCRPAR